MWKLVYNNHKCAQKHERCLCRKTRWKRWQNRLAWKFLGISAKKFLPLAAASLFWQKCFCRIASLWKGQKNDVLPGKWVYRWKFVLLGIKAFEGVLYDIVTIGIIAPDYPWAHSSLAHNKHFQLCRRRRASESHFHEMTLSYSESTSSISHESTISSY